MLPGTRLQPSDFDLGSSWTRIFIDSFQLTLRHPPTTTEPQMRQDMTLRGQYCLRAVGAQIHLEVFDPFDPRGVVHEGVPVVLPPVVASRSRQL